MEKTLNTLLGKQYALCLEQLESLISGYNGVPYTAVDIPTPEAIEEWRAAAIDVKWLWSRFKSPRQFFEGEGKALLRKDLDTILAPTLQAWMNVHIEQWTAMYGFLWHNSAEHAGHGLQNDLASYVEGKQSSLSDNADRGQLQELHEQLAQLQTS